MTALLPSRGFALGRSITIIASNGAVPHKVYLVQGRDKFGTIAHSVWNAHSVEEEYAVSTVSHCLYPGKGKGITLYLEMFFLYTVLTLCPTFYR